MSLLDIVDVLFDIVLASNSLSVTQRLFFYLFLAIYLITHSFKAKSTTIDYSLNCTKQLPTANSLFDNLALHTVISGPVGQS